jgi:sodium-dependent dicarboxylate transporter 2/3/5
VPWAVVLLGPALALALVLLPPPGDLPLPAWRTAAVALWMAVWWVTEAVPIAATSLLPLVLFPLLGIGSAQEAAAPYGNSLIFLFLGGFLLALGLARWDLHRRLALAVVLALGTRPARLVAGFTTASALLSMGISNSATAMMMLPLGTSVIGRVGQREGGRSFARALVLGVAYGSSIGGLGTLIGTPTNALVVAFARDQYGIEISFLRWLGIGLPLVAVGLPLAVLVLTRWATPVTLDELPGGRAVLAREREALGPLSVPERRVAAVLGMTALLWIAGPLVARLAGVRPLDDASIAIGGALLLFLLPAGTGRGERLLSWDEARQLPWGVLLLFGGGLTLADALRRTGLSEALGQALAGAGHLPVPVLLGLVLLVVLVLTELASNTATAAAVIPVLAPLSVAAGIPPLSLLVPATLIASCGFMLAVGTPPNAIAYASGWVSLREMARAGLWLNLLFLVLVAAAGWWWVPLVLG